MLVFQASASTVPFWQRPEGTLNYAGPGSFIKNLSPGGTGDAGTITAHAVDYDRASELLGGDSVVDCPPNGIMNWDEAVDALTTFVNRMGGSAMTIQPKLCHHAEAGSTLAQICNHSDRPIDVTPDAAQAAFDLLAYTCTNRRSSGTIQTANGLQFVLSAKVDVGRQNAKRRSSGKLAKRCINPNTREVTGCEDIVCDPPIKMNESGDCPNVGNVDTDGCAYYCEVKAAKYYGVPTIYDDTRYCRPGGNNCYIKQTEKFTVEKSVSVNFSLKGAGPLESVLSAGVSSGIATAKMTVYRGSVLTLVWESVAGGTRYLSWSTHAAL